ncbi:transcription factor HES-1-B isoform X2 [Nematostella vectensis]|nr:transcription factor HES-1-B isoform X2 [Nematostella vectensis]
MEKKRRSRINTSLNELRCLLLDHRQLDELQVALMEKAEILETAVQFLKEHGLGRSQTQTNHRLAGYSACAKEVYCRLRMLDNIDDSLRERMVSSVYSRCAVLQQTHGPLESTILPEHASDLQGQNAVFSSTECHPLGAYRLLSLQVSGNACAN